MVFFQRYISSGVHRMFLMNAIIWLKMSILRQKHLTLSPGGGSSLDGPLWGPNLSLFLFYISSFFTPLRLDFLSPGGGSSLDGPLWGSNLSLFLFYIS